MTLLTTTVIDCDSNEEDDIDFCEAHFEVTLNWGEFGNEAKVRRQLMLRGWISLKDGERERFLCPLHRKSKK